MRLKRTGLLLIISLFITASIKAQVTFQNNTKYFNVRAPHPETPQGSWRVMKLVTDSIKGEKTFYTVWHKVYVFNTQLGPYTKFLLMIQDKYRVYAKSLTDTIPILMYDFSKEKGDTITFGYSFPDNYTTVIDSTGYKSINGVLRKVQYITVNSSTYQLIEGIGCLGTPDRNPGLFVKFIWGLAEADAPCVGICIDQNIIYGPITTDCQRDTLVEINIAKMPISKVYPNPSENELTVTANLKIKDIYMYDHIGKEVIKINDVDSEEIKIDIANLPEGIYHTMIDMGTTRSLKSFIIKKGYK